MSIDWWWAIAAKCYCAMPDESFQGDAFTCDCGRPYLRGESGVWLDVTSFDVTVDPPVAQ